MLSNASGVSVKYTATPLFSLQSCFLFIEFLGLISKKIR
jgi:hypothetical protein